MEITVHFLVLRKKLVSYFASINRDVTIIINFENIADDNALLAKLRKKQSILGTFLTQASA